MYLKLISSAAFAAVALGSTTEKATDGNTKCFIKVKGGCAHMFNGQKGEKWFFTKLNSNTKVTAASCAKHAVRIKNICWNRPTKTCV